MFSGFLVLIGKSSTSGYVNFELFINALYEIAIHSLSKHQFAEIYPTAESKVHFLCCKFLVVNIQCTDILLYFFVIVLLYLGQCHVELVGVSR